MYSSERKRRRTRSRSHERHSRGRSSYKYKYLGERSRSRSRNRQVTRRTSPKDKNSQSSVEFGRSNRRSRDRSSSKDKSSSRSVHHSDLRLKITKLQNKRLVWHARDEKGEGSSSPRFVSESNQAYSSRPSRFSNNCAKKKALQLKTARIETEQIHHPEAKLKDIREALIKTDVKKEISTSETDMMMKGGNGTRKEAVKLKSKIRIEDERNHDPDSIVSDIKEGLIKTAVKREMEEDAVSKKDIVEKSENPIKEDVYVKKEYIEKDLRQKMNVKKEAIVPRVLVTSDKGVYFKPERRQTEYYGQGHSYAHCHICMAYYKDDEGEKNLHLQKHPKHVFKATVPQDIFFYDIEEVISHYAKLGINKEDISKKIFYSKIVHHPPNLSAFSCSKYPEGEGFTDFSSVEDCKEHIRECFKVVAEQEVEHVIPWCRGCQTQFQTVDQLFQHVEDFDFRNNAGERYCFPNESILDKIYESIKKKPMIHLKPVIKNDIEENEVFSIDKCPEDLSRGSGSSFDLNEKLDVQGSEAITGQMFNAFSDLEVSQGTNQENKYSPSFNISSSELLRILTNVASNSEIAPNSTVQCSGDMYEQIIVTDILNKMNEDPKYSLKEAVIFPQNILCKVCNVTMPNYKDFNDHMVGRRHWKNMKNVEKGIENVFSEKDLSVLEFSRKNYVGLNLNNAMRDEPSVKKKECTENFVKGEYIVNDIEKGADVKKEEKKLDISNSEKAPAPNSQVQCLGDMYNMSMKEEVPLIQNIVEDILHKMNEDPKYSVKEAVNFPQNILCKVCNVTMAKDTIFKEHMAGKRHEKNMKNIERGIENVFSEKNLDVLKAFSNLNDVNSNSILKSTPEVPAASNDTNLPKLRKIAKLQKHCLDPSQLTVTMSGIFLKKDEGAILKLLEQFGKIKYHKFNTRDLEEIPENAEKLTGKQRRKIRSRVFFQYEKQKHAMSAISSKQLVYDGHILYIRSMHFKEFELEALLTKPQVCREENPKKEQTKPTGGMRRAIGFNTALEKDPLVAWHKDPEATPLSFQKDFEHYGPQDNSFFFSAVSNRHEKVANIVQKNLEIEKKTSSSILYGGDGPVIPVIGNGYGAMESNGGIAGWRNDSETGGMWSRNNDGVAIGGNGIGITMKESSRFNEDFRKNENIFRESSKNSGLSSQVLGKDLDILSVSSSSMQGINVQGASGFGSESSDYGMGEGFGGTSVELGKQDPWTFWYQNTKNM